MGGIVGSAMDAIISVDAAQRIVLFNTAAERLFGCTAAEVVGGPLDRFVPTRFHARHRGHIETFGATGETSRSLRSLGDLVARRANGEEFPIEASISQIDVAGEKIYTVILRDVTERKRAEAAAAELAAIVESSFDAIVGKDLDGRVRTWNAGAERVFGYTAAEMIGASISLVIPPERASDELEIMSRIRRGEAAEHFETVRRRKDGRLIDVSVTVSPMRDAEGNIIGASKVARDISEQKEAQAALRDSEELFSAAFRYSPAGLAINRRRDLVNLEAAVFTLAAGAERVLTASVATDRNFAKHTRHAVTFDVAAQSASGRQLSASQASVVELIPLVSGEREQRHFLPLQLRTMLLAESGHRAHLQTELSGAGSLDEAGKHRIDFIFRGPDIKDANLYGERAEYGASYHGEHWDIDLGDRLFGLTDLTERHVLGRGAGVRWQGGEFTLGAFYLTSRYRRVNTEEIGAFVRRDFGPDFSLQASFLRKWGGGEPGAALPQNIFSLQSHYRRGKLLDLTIEVAVSRSDAGQVDFAYRLAARGELPGRFVYSLEHTHAGPHFRGYYSDTDSTIATVSKTFGRLQLRASLAHFSDNLALNDQRSSVVNRESSWSVGQDGFEPVVEDLAGDLPGALISNY